MAIPTPTVSSTRPFSSSQSTAVSSPRSIPHAQDSMEMREPANPPSTCFCTSICSTISSIWRYIKTKILELLNCFFPRSTEARGQAAATAASTPSGFFTPAQGQESTHLVETREPDTAGTSSNPTEVCTSVQGQGNTNLSECQSSGATSSLTSFYHASLFVFISDPNASSRLRIETLKTLIDFHFNPNERSAGFAMHSAVAVEQWKMYIRQAVEALPEEIKRPLFERMWNLVQPRDGREAFLENPCSPEARQAVEETLQAFPNA